MLVSSTAPQQHTQSQHHRQGHKTAPARFESGGEACPRAPAICRFPHDKAVDQSPIEKPRQAGQAPQRPDKQRGVDLVEIEAVAAQVRQGTSIAATRAGIDDVPLPYIT